MTAIKRPLTPAAIRADAQSVWPWLMSKQVHRVGFVALTLISLIASALLAIQADVVLSPLPLFAAMVLYLIAHTFRAVRLAMLATPLVGISGRTAMLLHFTTAPAALLVPFKLGEILRLQQLASLGGRWDKALIVLMIDRLFDASVLTALIALVWFTAYYTAGWDVTLTLTFGVLLMATVALTLGPRVLTVMQSYMVTHYENPAILRQLPNLHKLRDFLLVSAQQLSRQWAALALLSILIWTVELVAVMVALTGLSTSLETIVSVLISRIDAGPSAFGSPEGGQLMATWAALGLSALWLIWPACLYFYLKRRLKEPARIHCGPA